jgi:two-component system, OmpR family, sensor histidine kinase KdpD
MQPPSDGRPPPERFLSLIREQQRGRLKIYLGYAPGVGKTYRMLQEGQLLKRQGVDVVIGVVETHGRADTAAMVDGLEQVPRRRIEYHGVVLEEMDLDGVLRRHPMIALVDELAHTNAPGSRYPKRYQDVEELLRAGINVISTMNIQHLEGLYDMIEHFAGVKVKERVPDYVLSQAVEIVNVDVTAEDLQERLKSGKVYPTERVERALINFFTESNLNRLRELAMEEIAQALDRRRQDREGGAKVVSERIMVCLSSRSPHLHFLLRRAARLAGRFNAPWYAVYIRTPQETLEKIDAATERSISDSLELARQLGGTSLPYQGPTFQEAVATFVNEYGITHVLVGRSQRPWYRRWFGQSPLDRLLQAVPNVDVVVVASPG